MAPKINSFYEHLSAAIPAGQRFGFGGRLSRRTDLRLYTFSCCYFLLFFLYYYSYFSYFYLLLFIYLLLFGYFLFLLLFYYF